MKNVRILIILSLLVSNIILSQNYNENNSAVSSECYQSLTFDGSWCWFSDPRAVYYEGEYKRTYAGWIDSYGDVIIGYYDHDTKEISTKVLEDNFQIDDHNNPALLFAPDGRLLVFFSKHSKKDPIQMYTMKNSEDISEWDKKELVLNDAETYNGYRDSYTYVNPVMLSEENNRIYLFWRGMDYKPNYSYSDDMGSTWSKGRILVLPERIYQQRRPYMKVESNGNDRIAFAFTDGHPRKENNNSIYYMSYKDGKFFAADNKVIGVLDGEPIQPRQCSVVYDATVTKEKAWIWDVAIAKDGNPVLVYAKFPDDENHMYSYAKWDGAEWVTNDLTNSGRWFPQTKKGEVESEPNYSGGLVVDHENTNVVYLSAKRDSVFEIEKWTLDGNEWESTSITKGSSKDNVRPFAVRNAGENNPLQIFWMQNTRYIHYTDYHSSLKMNIISPVTDDVYDATNIKNIMRQTADWQLANPFTKVSRLEWHWGAFYIGLDALYETTREDRYLNEMINLGDHFNWKLIDDIYHADRIAIADVYAWLYGIKHEPNMIEKTKWAMDIHIARRPKADVRFTDNDYKLEWWSWCDALFMAPPSFAAMYKVTNEIKYLDYADKHWWITSDYLYSVEDSLFYRDDRFFDRKTSNGKKVFWSRGNGWVVSGLARMLSTMPESYPTREKYIRQFKEMAAKLLSLQKEDGMWTASLYDPEELPLGESSGTAFFTYALTWGVNNGLLEREKYEQPIRKAWKALTNNVNEWGRLGYVQQVAGDPYPFYKDQWQVYATGALLMCGKEMITFIGDK